MISAGVWTASAHWSSSEIEGASGGIAMYREADASRSPKKSSHNDKMPNICTAESRLFEKAGIPGSREYCRIQADSANSPGCSGQATLLSITLPDPLRGGANWLVGQEVSGPAVIRNSNALWVVLLTADRTNAAGMLFTTRLMLMALRSHCRKLID